MTMAQMFADVLCNVEAALGTALNPWQVAVILRAVDGDRSKFSFGENDEMICIHFSDSSLATFSDGYIEATGLAN